jgi:hypothetical protein
MIRRGYGRALALAGLALLTAGAAHAADPPFPCKAGDAAPSIDGVSLGQTEAQALAVLGAPAKTGKLSGDDVWDYANGLEVIANNGDGVSIIRLLAPGAGSVGRVKVGDTTKTVVAKWGDSDTVSLPDVALWNCGVWTLEARATNGVVTTILLGWNQTKWPNENPKNPTYYRPN